jgi:hypothetical protein
MSADLPLSVRRSETNFAPSSSGAWLFMFSNGRQNALGTDNGFFAWAVRAGDVPEPSSIGLAVLALLSLLLLRKRS